jgi:capsular exopolysaccharide synthesis family protein
MQDRNEPFAEQAPTVTLREYLDILRRRRAIILQTFVIVLIIGVVWTMTLAPVYTASARLLVEPPGPSLNLYSGQPDAFAEMFQQSGRYSMGTQIELLQAPDIRKKVADKIGGGLPGMSVQLLEGTSILVVSASGDNPETVASAPNTLLDVYAEYVGDRRGKELQRAIDFAENQRNLATKELRQVEGQIRAFKSKSKVAELEVTRRNQIELVREAKGQVDALSGQIAAIEARVTSTKQAMADLEAQGKTTLVSVVSDKQDPAVLALEDQKSQLQLEKRILLDNQKTDIHPDVVALTERIGLLDKRIADKRRTTVVRNQIKNPRYESLSDSLIGFGIDLSALNMQLASAYRSYADAQKRLAQFPDWETTLDELTRRRDAAAKSADSFNSRIEDMKLRMETRPKMARVLEYATTPTAPVKPNRPQNIIFAGLLGLLLGLGVALLQELFDDRINSPEEAERVLHLPNLGQVPLIEEEGLRLIRDISTFSPLMESYRTLRTNLNFAAVGSPLRSLVVTSSLPAEGKSTTVANLAMAMAFDGRNVIIVDADLRRPSQHHLFKLGASPGLTDILVGTHRIEDVMVPVPNMPGVSLIPAGSPPPNPAELLGSTAMGHFLAEIETLADVVILDTPPTLAVADSVVLSARADGVLMVVSYGDTKKANVKQAKDILNRANANVLGTVLNRMDSSASGYYYYGKYYVPVSDAGQISGTAGDGVPSAPSGAPVVSDSDDTPTRITAAAPASDGAKDAKE